jgi:N-methylhydantoinase B/oxoprolinase/acetone carboxylase alpha subunit
MSVQAREPAARRQPANLDPFSAEIMRNYLISTVREMVTTTVRTAYSTCFSEGEDFTCGLFDRNGNMIAQAAGITVHAGGLTLPVRHFLEKFGDFEPGDVIIHNDPYTGATHQADGAIFRPMFYEDTLIGFSINRGHWTDIGGMAPGGWAGTARHVIQEALRLPATRLYRKGVLNTEIRDLIEHNVRFSRQWWGDVQAQIASNITAERRLQMLIRKYGLDEVLGSFDAAIDYSRRRFLKAMEAIPNTTVTAHDVYMEDDGFGDGPYRVKVTITKTPEKIIVDYDGTDAQALSTVNCTQGVARAATYAPLIAVLDPDIPLNQGVIDLIEFRAPAGCLVNPVYPAPCFASTADPGDRISEIMQLALSKLVPERVTAGCYATGNNLTAGGYDPARGEDFVWYIFESGGCGARATKDGNSAEWHLMANCKNESMEVWEQRYPVKFLRYEFVQDSAGPGKWRGGLGVTRQLELTLPTVLTANADRHIIPPPGFFGGGNGTVNRFSIVRNGQDRTFKEWFDIPSPSKFSNVPTHVGDVLAVTQGGGGGYGSPLDRDPALVAADVLDGYVSGAHARDDYGVILDPATGAVDRAATERERAARAASGNGAAGAVPLDTR